MDSQPRLDPHIDVHPGVAVLRTGIYVAAGVVAVCDGIRAGAAAVARRVRGCAPRVRSFVKRIRSFPEVDSVDDPPYPFLPYGGNVRPFKDRPPRSEPRRAASS